MNILITRNADTSNFGGAETFVLHLAQGLNNEKGFNVVVGTKNPQLRDRLRGHGINTIKSPWMPWQRWHGVFTLLLPLHFLWTLRMAVWYSWATSKYNIDVLHPQNRDDWIAATMIGKMKGIPVIWTDHADLKHELKNVSKFKNLLGKSVLHWAKKAQAITVVSHSEHKAIEAQVHSLLDDKITVIHNGTFDTKVSPEKPTSEAFAFGLTTRLLEQKGIKELITAFVSMLPKAGQDIQLIIIGDGPDRDKFKEMAMGHPIYFLGYKKEPLRHVAGLDVFVFPSHTEGFSLSLVEASMLGKPIIATAVGGNPEIIENNHTGLLVPSHSSKKLEEAMLLLLKDEKLRKQLGANARKTFEVNFEFQQLVHNRFVPLYNQIVKL